MITNTKLPKVGQRIGSECGPGEFAQDNSGIVIAEVTDRWGSHVIVLMDSGKTETCHSIRTEPGIGWHIIK